MKERKKWKLIPITLRNSWKADDENILINMRQSLGVTRVTRQLQKLEDDTLSIGFDCIMYTKAYDTNR